MVVSSNNLPFIIFPIQTCTPVDQRAIIFLYANAWESTSFARHILDVKSNKSIAFLLWRIWIYNPCLTFVAPSMQQSVKCYLTRVCKVLHTYPRPESRAEIQNLLTDFRYWKQLFNSLKQHSRIYWDYPDGPDIQ